MNLRKTPHVPPPRGSNRSREIYDLVAHMKKVPALMSLFDALRFTPGPRAALEMALEETAVAFGEAEGQCN